MRPHQHREDDMETMDIEQTASYLSRDVREVGKLASRGVLPGRKVGGAWRFARAEINHWMANRMHECTPDELEALESARPGEDAEEPLLAGLLRVDTVAVPLRASTKSSVLRELARLAEKSWVVYDTDAVASALTTREEMGSTALPGGVAFPHPHRPLSSGVLGESMVAFARTTSGIAFGAPHGGLSDLFFLILCTDDRTHLRLMARLARLLQREGFVERLREAEDAEQAFETLVRAEQELLS